MPQVDAMSAEADVLVLAPDLPKVALIAEVRTPPDDRGELSEERQDLRARMLRNKAAVGLMVTPDRTWVYHDTYADSDEPIELVDEFPTALLLGLTEPPASERELVRSLVHWLRRLTTGSPAALPSAASVRNRLARHLLPAMAEGRVQTTGPV
ncbi:MAG: hypothetical protein KF878_10640 [Planctomycetes bacterium]|nr:hypothetical protein [Planctomycetota bacterium]